MFTPPPPRRQSRDSRHLRLLAEEVLPFERQIPHQYTPGRAAVPGYEVVEVPEEHFPVPVWILALAALAGAMLVGIVLTLIAVMI